MYFLLLISKMCSVFVYHCSFFSYLHFNFSSLFVITPNWLIKTSIFLSILFLIYCKQEPLISQNINKTNTQRSEILYIAKRAFLLCLLTRHALSETIGLRSHSSLQCVSVLDAFVPLAVCILMKPFSVLFTEIAQIVLKQIQM